MSEERKTFMISTRVSKTLVSRVDFVVRNTDGDALKNRSAAVLRALEVWLPIEEQKLRELGVLEKKPR